MAGFVGFLESPCDGGSRGGPEVADVTERHGLDADEAMRRMLSAASGPGPRGTGDGPVTPGRPEDTDGHDSDGIRPDPAAT
ncbi:hypothetical protein [Arthrobacter ruber]|uniref:hypothetical protein n=1 Tax=Arthrobacter ruber TaxID=1258893 RepID=UPI000CF417D6|nr:hypothetical protein [Arthrobacter ruber]